MQFISPVKKFADKALKVALSLLLVVGFLPIAEREAEAVEKSSVKIVSVSCYDYGSAGGAYALAQDGSLYAWGDNWAGQVGDGARDNRLSPVKVMDGVASVECTATTTYAITQDGSLYAWGYNACGQVGDGTGGQGGSYYCLSPVKVMEGVASVECVNDTAYAITQDGSLYAWGGDASGTYVNDVRVHAKTPVKILDNVASIQQPYSTAYALAKDGSLYVWGSNMMGQVGNGSNGAGVDSPVKVMDGVSSVKGASLSTYALTKDGSLYAWGNNQDGNIGIGSTQDSIWSPVKVMDGVSSVFPYGNTVHAVTADGSLYAWGYSWFGNVGNGSKEDCLSPVKVMDGVLSVENEGGAIYAITSAGALYAWGGNSYGQVGNGTSELCLSPVEVLGGSVSSVQCVDSATHALTDGGSLCAWGKGADGRLGNGSSENCLAPVKILDGVSSVYRGYRTGYAVTEDGSLYAWGSNSHGQLGIGTAEDSYSPVLVDFSNVEDATNPDSGDPVEPDDPSVDEPSEPDAPTSSDTIEATALIRSEKDEFGCTEYPITWDNDWFLEQDGGKYGYNPDLAVTACAIAGAAYAGTELGGETATQRLDFVHTTLSNVGFKDIDVSSYSDRLYNSDADYQDTFDLVAYAFANKRIPDGKGGWDTLVAVAVRGTPGNVEWISNANVDDTNGKKNPTSGSVGHKTHEGFDRAKGEMWDALHEYMEEHDIDPENAKYLVTGHSRGAAVANLTAASLTRQYGTKGVYAYCYATPRAEADPNVACDSEIFNNIYNVVNPEDFVPRVALEKWGYQRYGKTYYLPSSTTQSSLWLRLIDDVKAGYLKYFDKKFKYFKGTGKTDNLVKNVYAMAPSVYDAYTEEYTHVVTYDSWLGTGLVAESDLTFIEYFTGLMKFIAYGSASDAGRFILDSSGSYAPITGYFVNNHVLHDRIFGAHSEKTYLLWLDELNDAGVTPIQAGQKCDTGKMTMYCPVDVTVYDPDGNVVARIVDDVADEELAESDEGLAAYVDPETGAKSVWVPLGQGYRVETVATDSGTLDVTWSVSDPEGETLSQEARVDLPLEEGTTYTADVSDQGGEGAFEDSVSFVDGDGEEIQPDFESDAESAGSLEISVSATEGGTASGNAQATAGDHVTVSATAEPKYLFDGWYEGEELVSSEKTWTFRAEESRALEARFVLCGHPNGTNPCDICGYAEFTIEDCDIVVEPDPFTYAGSAKPDVTVSFAGVELVEGEDYSLHFGVGGGSFGGPYRGNWHACVSPITGPMANRPGWFLRDHPTEEEFNVGYKLVDAKLTASMISFPQASYVYNGKVQKPKPKVKVADTVQYASSYEFTYLNKSKKKKASPKLVGTYWIRVKSKPTANTEGTVWKKLVIKPKAVASTGVTRLNNGFKVKWQKRTAQVSGYQVQYRLKGSSSWKSRKVSYRYSSTRVTGLKDKRTYEVRVRIYKKASGITYYSAWSPVKTVKTK